MTDMTRINEEALEKVDGGVRLILRTKRRQLLNPDEPENDGNDDEE